MKNPVAKVIKPARGGLSKTSITTMAILSLVFVLALPVLAVPPPAPGILDPAIIPKFTNMLDAPPPVYVPTIINSTGEYYKVNVTEFLQQILPTVDALNNPTGFGSTKVWGYGGLAKHAITGALLGYVRGAPGPTFEATRNIPIYVTWQNNLTNVAGTSLPHMFAVDPTLHWADPNNFGMPMSPFQPYPPGYAQAQSPVPLIPHLHGGEVQSTFDGHPQAWFTPNGIHGPAYNTKITTDPNAAVFHYPNAQPPTTLWYHDHALGITRINVMSGLAGFYLLREPIDTVAPLLPNGKYEMPLVIQDRTFNIDGSFWFPTVGINPADHPYWMPEFFGNTIMVNGKVWPNMNVDAGQYRFRLLDGSNARFYTISFWDMNTDIKLPFIQIGSDGGYLKSPVTLMELTIAPGERADILVDFTGLSGHKIRMTNRARAPFPKGAPPDPNTAQIMQFTVGTNPGPAPAVLPATLNPTLAGPGFPTLPAKISRTRILTLWEVMGALGPLEILLNGQKWAGRISENVTKGAIEEWVIVNPTADTHPIHLHLVQFQLVSRQSIDTKKYVADWVAMQTDPGLYGTGMPPWTFGYIPLELPIAPYLKGKAAAAPPNEQGWKDTIQMNPGEVTIIRIRFAPIDGSANYPFDPAQGPGYVWHCHILDHEDNEMMRPYLVKP